VDVTRADHCAASTIHAATVELPDASGHPVRRRGETFTTLFRLLRHRLLTESRDVKAFMNRTRDVRLTDRCGAAGSVARIL
jgi:hypothetical protein